MDLATPLTIDHIVVPLDGSHLAEVAIEPAIALAARLHAHVTLLHVLERGAPATVHHDRHLTNPAEAEVYLEGIATRVAAAGIIVTHHTHPNPEEDVAGSIAGHARELDAHLIVLCTHGHGGPRQWLTGSLAQRVIRHAEVPVLLVRPEGQAASPFSPRIVLTALDGTEAGEAIVPAAVTLASAFDAVLHLVITVPTLSTVSGDRVATARLTPTATTAALELEATGATDYMQRMAARLDGTGIAIQTEIVRGDAVRTMVDRVTRDPQCLLALATHGRGGFDALWSASVGSRVVNRVSGPLLLVRPAEDPDK
jgi:nucleotide-binding universal stress UspA family protein